MANKILNVIQTEEKIYSARFCSSCVIITLLNEVKVFSRTNLKELRCYKTIENPLGICCTSRDNDVICVLGKKVGEIRVILLKDGIVSDISAHKSFIHNICLNSNGTKVASASVKGTIIRIFDTLSGKKIKEVRRGTTRRNMYSICFSNDSKDLCCYSSSGTIHTFSICEENKEKNRTSIFNVVKYVGFSYIGSEWSKFFKQTDEKPSLVPVGKCVFREKNNTIFLITENGRFEKISFENDKQNVEKVNLFELLKSNDLEEPTSSTLEKKEKNPKENQESIEKVKIIFEETDDSSIPKLKERKFIVPAKFTISKFTKVVQQKFLENKKTEINLLINNGEVLCHDDQTLGELYQKEKSNDDILYMKYISKL